MNHNLQEDSQAAALPGATPVNIDALAEQARLHLPEKEKTTLQADIEDMLRFAGALFAINTEGVAPFAPAAAPADTLREDTAVPSDFKDSLLAGAPASKNDHILVPGVRE